MRGSSVEKVAYFWVYSNMDGIGSIHCERGVTTRGWDARAGGGGLVEARYRDDAGTRGVADAAQCEYRWTSGEREAYFARE